MVSTSECGCEDYKVIMKNIRNGVWCIACVKKIVSYYYYLIKKYKKWAKVMVTIEAKITNYKRFRKQVILQ